MSGESVKRRNQNILKVLILNCFSLLSAVKALICLNYVGNSQGNHIKDDVRAWICDDLHLSPAEPTMSKLTTQKTYIKIDDDNSRRDEDLFALKH